MAAGGPATESDGDLLRRAARGDRDAFSAFYVRHETIVAGYLARRAASAEQAADLTIETFAAAMLSAGRFRDDGGSALGWLLGIARNLLARSRERRRIELRARAKLGVDPIVFSDATLERVEALIDATNPDNPLLAAFEALPDDQREAIRARVLDEQPYPDIASSLGVAEATVRQRVSRGLSRLRGSVEGERR